MSNNNSELAVTDVLVIGSGGAGLRAAFEASKLASKVILITKGEIGKCGSTAFDVAEFAGFNAPDGMYDHDDSPEIFFQDIINAGLGCLSSELATIIAENAVRQVEFLESVGVDFVREGDGYKEVFGCYASKPRMHLIPGHGKSIVHSLSNLIKDHDISILENHAVVDLLKSEEGVIGAVAIDSLGRYKSVICSAVVVATGGGVQIYRTNINPPDVTGDGYAIAIRIGANLSNMEFVQEVPSIVNPKLMLMHHWMWSARPLIRNRFGREIWDNYISESFDIEEALVTRSDHGPFSTRDVSRHIDIAMQKEVFAGRGTVRNGIYLDFRKIARNRTLAESMSRSYNLRELWDSSVRFLLNNGIDIENDLVEIAVCAHAINGGIVIDSSGMSNVAGLFAAGETCSGPHGADRLGGNMLLTCQVFGEICGKSAARYAKEHARDKLSQDMIKDIIPQGRIDWETSKERMDAITAEIREIMWNGCLVVRNCKTLNKTLARLNSLEAELCDIVPKSSQLMVDWYTLRNMLLTSKLIATAASTRKESRGAHFREDFPLLNSSFDKSILLKAGNKQGSIIAIDTNPWAS
jgi:fumarate reductase (CoM/CoB) subunit A